MAGEPTITVMGRLGGEPELHFSKNGKAVANFSVAVTPTAKDGDNWIEKETMWFKCSLWRKAEDFTEEARKGALVIVTGKLLFNSYTTKDGVAKQEVLIEADGVGFVATQSKKTEQAPW